MLLIPITMAFAEGGYTAPVFIGSQGKRVQLVLDTGSSALAVRQSCYQVADDADVQLSADFQIMSYGAGGWAGSMVQSTVAVGHPGDTQLKATAEFAVIVDEPSHNFYQADGIWGLAYQSLDSVYQAQQFLSDHQTDPTLSWSWPWPSQVLDPTAPLSSLREQLQSCPRRHAKPFFSALQKQQQMANSFALLTRRAVYHHSGEDATSVADILDPLNKGLLVLGGGEECTELYQGTLSHICLVHDKYYNTELLQIQIDGCEAFAVPALDEQDLKAYGSNSIFDCGSSFLILEASCYQYVIDELSRLNPDFAIAINAALEARNSMSGIAMDQLQLSAWPDILLSLTGEKDGSSEVVTLRVQAKHYWQQNAPVVGEVMFLLGSQLEGWAKQSILGLPVLNDKFCVFDRSADNGMGVIKVAQAV